VSFPSGSDSTKVTVFQAQEMVDAGCDEIDMVMNIGRLRSGQLNEVESDVRAVIEAAGNLPVKVIIEIMYLNQSELVQACNICIKAGLLLKDRIGWGPRHNRMISCTQLCDERIATGKVDPQSTGLLIYRRARIWDQFGAVEIVEIIKTSWQGSN
jgi:deoxyribose-phosphate aldolase